MINDAEFQHVVERVQALEAGAEAHAETIIQRVDAAGIPGDVAHVAVITIEAARLDALLIAEQAKVNQLTDSRLLNLFGITGGLQNASLRLFGVLLLIAVAVTYGLLRAAGL